MPKITPIHYRKLVKVFELAGAEVTAQKGSHIIISKLGTKRRLIIPTYKQIPVFIIKNNMRTANMSRERYFELLKKVG